MRVPLLDLGRQHAQVREAVEARVAGVFASQHFVLGPVVEEFEEAMRAFIGCDHAVGMSSGTDAQLAILMAMDIGPGHAVITTPYTFFATAGCLHRLGVEAVFVDIEPATFHMAPAKLRECLQSCRCTDGAVLTARGNRVRAVIPIHLFGSICDMDAIGAIAREFGVELIADAAQACGAARQGAQGIRKAGAIVDQVYFSFYPTKNLGGAGDGGMVTCRSGAMAEKLRMIRNHGMGRQYHHHIVGGNFRLDTLQAAVLHAKLPLLDSWNARRQEHARHYGRLFQERGLTEFVTPPVVPPGQEETPNPHIYHQYVIRAQNRDGLMAHLKEQGIGCAVYYPIPLHLQECFDYLGHKEGDFPVSEQAAKDSLALPIFPELREDEIEAVVSEIGKFFN